MPGQSGRALPVQLGRTLTLKRHSKETKFDRTGVAHRASCGFVLQTAAREGYAEARNLNHLGNVG